VIRPVPEEWHPRMPERLDEEELADWRAGRNAVDQLAALTVGARLAVADAWPSTRAPGCRASPKEKPRRGMPGFPDGTTNLGGTRVASGNMKWDGSCSVPYS